MSLPITQYLEAANRGEPEAAERLYQLVYDSLRQIAVKRLGQEHGHRTLQPTELVHEAWIRLGGHAAIGCTNRLVFFAAAAEAMRRTLVDNARKRHAAKRGGAYARRVDLLEHEPTTSTTVEDELLDLHDALAIFEQIEPLKSQVVKLKFFAGLTIAEIAAVANLSHATVERYWAFSRAWFFDHIHGKLESEGDSVKSG